jgi:hypothetical protein
MEKAGKDMGSWDKLEDTESFREQIGKKHGKGADRDIMGYQDNAGSPGMISMPDEVLAADNGSFREQLPSQDGGDKMTETEFNAATRDQLEDEPS